MTDEPRASGGRPGPKKEISDDELVDAIRAGFEEDEPLPPGATDFAVQAFAWRSIDADLAELLHDSDVEGLVAVRDLAVARVFMLRSGGVTLDAEYRADELRGAVAPSGRYSVAAYDGGRGQAHPAIFSVSTDEHGFFGVDGEIHGAVRIVVSTLDHQALLVSPWLTF